MRSKRLLIFTLLAALIMSACGVIDQDDEVIEEDQSALPILVGYSPVPGFSALNIADKMGFFVSEGAIVQMLFYENYADSLEAFRAGKLDAVAGSVTDFVSMADSDVPLSLVWVLDSPLTFAAVIGNNTVSTPADLKGKKVGFIPGTQGHLFVQAVLNQAGLSEADITPVELTVEQVPEALAAGEIDAGYSEQPWITRAQFIAQAKTVITTEDAPGFIADGLAFRDEVLQKRPKTMKAFVRALDKAMDYWQQNPAEGNVICAQANGIPEAEVLSILSSIQIFTLEDNRLAFENNDDIRSLYRIARLNIDFSLEQGLIQTAPELDSFINPSFVKG